MKKRKRVAVFADLAASCEWTNGHVHRISASRLTLSFEIDDGSERLEVPRQVRYQGTLEAARISHRPSSVSIWRGLGCDHAFVQHSPWLSCNTCQRKACMTISAKCPSMSFTKRRALRLCKTKQTLEVNQEPQERRSLSMAGHVGAVQWSGVGRAASQTSAY